MTQSNNHINTKITVWLKVLLSIIIVYFIIGYGNQRLIKIPFLVVLIATLIVNPRSIYKPVLWSLIAIILGIDLATGYFFEANHHFLLFYLVLVTLLYTSIYKTQIFLYDNIKYLTFIVLALSGIQKWLSTSFTSGDFYYYLINTGQIFERITPFFHDASQTISENRKAIGTLWQTNPANNEIIPLKEVFPNTRTFSLFLSWITIGYELLVAGMILIKPKSLLTHILFILLIIGIFMTRMETGFLATLSLCGYLLTTHKITSWVYFILSLFFIILMVSRIGFS